MNAEGQVPERVRELVSFRAVPAGEVTIATRLTVCCWLYEADHSFAWVWIEFLAARRDLNYVERAPLCAGVLRSFEMQLPPSYWSQILHVGIPPTKFPSLSVPHPTRFYINLSLLRACLSLLPLTRAWIFGGFFNLFSVFDSGSCFFFLSIPLLLSLSLFHVASAFK